MRSCPQFGVAQRSPVFIRFPTVVRDGCCECVCPSHRILWREQRPSLRSRDVDGCPRRPVMSVSDLLSFESVPSFDRVTISETRINIQLLPFWFARLERFYMLACIRHGFQHTLPCIWLRLTRIRAIPVRVNLVRNQHVVIRAQTDSASVL
jgi:hypothetical protein